MHSRHDLSHLSWTLAGWTPYVWQQQRSIESGVSLNAEIPAIPASVPGSVQAALREAGLLPDWNVGLNARLCEWVENRHWIYTAHMPEEWFTPGCSVWLRALGLDYTGWILLNGRRIASFAGSLQPHSVDLTPHLRDGDNTLQIVFDSPPRWLGQIGYTSSMKEWKPRFNYFWDWTCRLVQIGIWDDLYIDVSDGNAIGRLDCTADIAAAKGTLGVHARVEGDRSKSLRVELAGADGPIRVEDVPVSGGGAGLEWIELPIEPWWPNGEGEQPLYTLTCILLDNNGAELDRERRRIGFKSVHWEACEGAPRDADPWICVVNGRPLFLQGVNWTPILPNFADVPDERYRELLTTYRDMGCNLLRVWGGAFLEKEVFYQLCDELGLLVWQEFPLSSSGLDNWPPDDPQSIAEMAAIARSYIERRRHHVSLLLWCGGNELQGPPGPGERPAGLDHPLLDRLAEVVAAHDPQRRFLPTSSSGPRFGADEVDFGKGLHWDVHGPWHVSGDLHMDYVGYWQEDDALFRSEVGAAGASPVDIIRAYRGDLPEVPGTRENPLWRRTSWWIEWPQFVEEKGREPVDLEEYVAWSQERQREALRIAASASKGRFPRCGGFIVWMGHDSFPCTANTSIVDFYGRLKPAGVALGAVYRESIDSRPIDQHTGGD